MVMSRSVLMGRYSLGGVVLLFILDRIRPSRTGEGSSRGRKKGVEREREREVY